MPLAIVAIGGNALSPKGDVGDATSLRRAAAEAARQLVDLVDAGFRLVVTHGNGPQVGNILLQNEEARQRVPAMPLDVCVAESQAQIGYALQQAIHNELARRDKPVGVASVVTQVIVDPDDVAFRNPTKPVGPYYRTEAELVVGRAKGWAFRPDDRGGWRRVVPSPRPLEVVEADLLGAMLKGDNGVLIAAGGGGIPVVHRGDELVGVEAVVDKDLASAVLGIALGADLLLIATDVPRIALNFGRRDQVELDRLPRAEARRHLAAGQFPPGTMGPKVEAALQFLDGGGKRAVVTDLAHLLDAVSGRAGTTIS